MGEPALGVDPAAIAEPLPGEPLRPPLRGPALAGAVLACAGFVALLGLVPAPRRRPYLALVAR